MAKDATGLLHISDRLFTGELSRVEAARGVLYPLLYRLKKIATKKRIEARVKEVTGLLHISDRLLAGE